jgi:hypothetical protein
LPAEHPALHLIRKSATRRTALPFPGIARSAARRANFALEEIPASAQAAQGADSRILAACREFQCRR